MDEIDHDEIVKFQFLIGSLEVDIERARSTVLEISFNSL